MNPIQQTITETADLQIHQTGTLLGKVNELRQLTHFTALEPTFKEQIFDYLDLLEQCIDQIRGAILEKRNLNQNI